jgi:hypothetical protein
VALKLFVGETEFADDLVERDAFGAGLAGALAQKQSERKILGLRLELLDPIDRRKRVDFWDQQRTALATGSDAVGVIEQASRRLAPAPHRIYELGQPSAGLVGAQLTLQWKSRSLVHGISESYEFSSG